MKYLKLLVICGTSAFLYLFGSSILENAHNGYLRFEGRKVVKVINSQGSGGTGSLVKGRSGKKYVMTNGHVCRLAENNQLFIVYQYDIYVVRVIKSYQRNDLCVLEAPEASGSTFSLASSVDYGERTYTIGHPQLEPLSITVGELSGPVHIDVLLGVNMNEKECSGETYRYIKLPPDSLESILLGITSACVRDLDADATTMNSLPGNSGSPVTNIYGNIVGVLFAGNDSGVRSYVVPLEYVKDFLKDL